MKLYGIAADSGCDISPAQLRAWGVSLVEMTLQFDGEAEIRASQMPPEAFYRRLRDGASAHTAAVNGEILRESLLPLLRDGLDVLYLAFSSGLSSTYHAACLTAEELEQEFPGQRVQVIDSRCGSGGYGLLLYLAVQRKQAGDSLEELTRYLEDHKMSVCHWFTVDDLHFLRRGGRIGAATAVLGAALQVKPVLHMDEAGTLQARFNVRGRKKAIRALAERYGELALQPDQAPVYITHGDCIGDAEALAALLREQYGVEVQYIAPIGPVIGAHSGPGTLALYFLGKER